MKIHLPNSAFLGNLDAFLRNFDPSISESLEITANQKWLSLHPLVLSMVAALGLTVDPKRIKFDTPEATSAHYLVRMGLFKMMRVPCEIEIEEHAPEGRFIPLTQIRTSDEASTFVTEMIPLLHLDNPDHAQTIGHIITELVGNVLDHAHSRNGAILCAQYYKKSNSIRIGIADSGRGLKSTINRSHAADTDIEAIRLALWPGITGTTRKKGGTPQNAGAGLFIIKSIASVNRDLFVIYSGSGFYKMLPRKKGSPLRLKSDPFADRHSKGGVFPRWTGTVVGIDITLNQTQEFKVLLEAVSEAFYKARKTTPKRRKPVFL